MSSLIRSSRLPFLPSAPNSAIALLPLIPRIRALSKDFPHPIKGSRAAFRLLLDILDELFSKNAQLPAACKQFSEDLDDALFVLTKERLAAESKSWDISVDLDRIREQPRRSVREGWGCRLEKTTAKLQKESIIELDRGGRTRRDAFSEDDDMFSILEVGSEWNEINRRRKSYLNRFPELSAGCYAKLPFKLLLQRQLEARLSPPSSLPALPFGGPPRSPSSVSTAPSGPCYTYAEVLRRSKGLLARPTFPATSRSSPSSSPSFPSFSHPLIHGSRPSSLHLRFLHLPKPLSRPLYLLRSHFSSSDKTLWRTPRSFFPPPHCQTLLLNLPPRLFTCRNSHPPPLPSPPISWIKQATSFSTRSQSSEKPSFELDLHLLPFPPRPPPPRLLALKASSPSVGSKTA